LKTDELSEHEASIIQKRYLYLYRAVTITVDSRPGAEGQPGVRGVKGRHV